jgi:lipoprotein-anchoring transpeptidase ErfK/SrfK
MNGMSSRLAVIAMAAAMFATAAAAQTTTTAAVPAQETAQPDQALEREIVVSLEDRKLALIENGEIKKVYTVAVGKPSTPSPEGTFTIQRRVANPTYHHDGKTVLPGPNNPVGSRWMGLSRPGYGIHGTNEPKSIGKAASHGCIRMAKADLEEFYGMVAVGDTVRLIGHRDEETARLFNPADAPAPALATAQQPLQTANADAVPAAPAAADPAPGMNNTPAPVAAMVAFMGTR